MLLGDVLNKDELSSLVIAELKEFGIKFRKEKKTKSAQEKCCRRIFRMPLAALELTDVVLASGGVVQIPKFVADACQRILEQVETEGLFRKAGSANRQKEIRVGLEAGLPLGRLHHVIDVANVLKSFFRELPEPLIPPSIQEPLLRSLLAGERGTKPLLMTCLLLPMLNINTLAFFMQFLHTVSLSSHRNKMTTDNLAILFTPGLMPLADISGVRFANHVKVVKLLIEKSELIGVLPESIAEKLNHLAAKTPSGADKKKKKRRSGMFNGLRKIVGVIGSAENLDSTAENEPATPCLSKSAKKRKLADVSAFSAKKKKDLLALFPENEGVLPNTPFSEKETKKTRLSLGGRKVAKSSSSTSANGLPVERRWSMVGPGWNRKKHSQTEFDRKVEASNPSLSPIMSAPCIVDVDSPKENTPVETFEKDEDKTLSITEPTNAVCDYDFVRIPKSEYEAIKERVSAIETRISQEFGSVRDCILRSSSSDLDNSLSGPEKVLNKFEKTMEEAGNVTSPQTELLAKRLSRELKIRGSEEHKVIRSPSARKIGTMRRRSRENVKLARNKTWHISNKVTEVQPNIEVRNGVVPFYPKSNLKRGRPNTVFTGLHQPGSISKMEEDNIDDNNLNEGEKWTSAEIFFNNTNGAKRRSIGVQSTTDAIVEENAETNEFKTPAKRPKSNDETPMYITTINLNEAKTPMLPPKSTVKKASVSKSHSKIEPKNIQKPVPEDGLQGRASIARLRSQNAGMVMAKAKLFDELGSDVDKPKLPLRANENRRKSSIYQNKISSHNEANNCYLVPYKNLITQMPKDRMSDFSSAKTPRRKVTPKSPGYVQKRQMQKLSLSRQVIQNRATIENIVNDIENVSNNSDGNVKNNSLSRSANSGRKSSNADSPYCNTPRIKKPLQVNSPRRFVKTPRGQSNTSGGRRTPLKATPVGTRCSPRLKLQSENKYTS
ncbi:rho GTPase-activating protein 11A-like isoform X2 [Hermetia illucens]|uniref:rho GTPase-activating protein 11A-like isoform X2 n=1 Tax=Hermetia illucens TaxID=343691 RepID=UPI0018CC583F|nr:rho GTPase-activating protein 11A-like isoform X2 [Hermetia illucens]